MENASIPSLMITSETSAGQFSRHSDSVPSVFTFMPTAVRQARRATFVLQNRGDFDLVLTGVAFTSGLNFTLEYEQSIPIGTSRSMTVSFVPRSEGAISDTLVLSYSNGVGAFENRIDINGTGLPAAQFDCALSTSTDAAIPSGDGSAEDPYVICTEAQFVALANNSSVWSAHFALLADLDFSAYDGSTPEKTIHPIASYANVAATGTPFTGHFDGNNHKLSNLAIDETGQGIATGIFAYTSGATIENLIVESVDIKGDRAIGGLVGRSLNSNFRNITVSGLVQSGATTANTEAGGVIGYYLASGSGVTVVIDEVAGSGVGVSANQHVGGLVGFVEGSSGATISVSNVSSSGGVQGTGSSTVQATRMAGLIGRISAGGAGTVVSLDSATSSADASGGDLVAGLVGAVWGTTGGSISISNSSATGNVSYSTRPGNTFGGLLSHLTANTATITVVNSYYQGTVTAPGSWNGLIASTASTAVNASITFTNVHARGTLASTGATFVATNNGNFRGNQSGGGFGTASASGAGSQLRISRCSFEGTVSYAGNPNVGVTGIGGFSGVITAQTGGDALISNSYSIATILLTTAVMQRVAGFSGEIYALTSGTGRIEDSYASTTGTFAPVSGSGQFGRFAGNNTSFTFARVYANSATHSTNVGAGSSTGITAANLTALMDQNTFVGWDFTTIWQILAGQTPTLRGLPF